VIVWYRHGPNKPWECYFSFTTGHTYSGPREWLQNAEAMMTGRGWADVLGRKREDCARRLVWC